MKPLAWFPPVVVLVGVLSLALWPLFGNKFLLISMAFFFFGLAVVVFAIAAQHRQRDAGIGSGAHRLVALLVVASLGASLTAVQFASILSTRLTIKPQATACARFAMISPSEAADRVLRALGVDPIEFRMTVGADGKPRFVPVE